MYECMCLDNIVSYKWHNKALHIRLSNCSNKNIFITETYTIGVNPKGVGGHKPQDFGVHGWVVWSHGISMKYYYIL